MGQVMDVQFCPFVSNLVASCAEDGKVKLWAVPPGGYSEHQLEPDLVMTGHKAKATVL